MDISKGQVIEFDVSALAFGGNGIGKYEGLTVFVNDSMPGDRVKAAVTKIKPKYWETKLVEVVKPATDRVEPKCRYSGVCGGCQLQFMPYEKQLEYKRQQVVDCFERIGKFANPPVGLAMGSENVFYYRNKMEFSFGYDIDMNFTLGMHVPGRKFDIMDLEECHLESQLSYEIVNKTRDFMRETGWPPFKYSNGDGFIKGIFIREGKRTGEVMINLRTSDKTPEDFKSKINEFVQVLLAIEPGEMEIVSIYWSEDISVRGQPRKIKEHLLYGRATINEQLIVGDDRLEFEIRPQSFFQVNTLQAEVLYSQVLRLAQQQEHKVVFDLFCGTGTIGLFLAKHVEKVIGIELNEESVKAARENARKNNIFNIDFFVGDVGKALEKIKEKPSLIVVDPPRAGLTEKMIQKISDFNSPAIIYVSCNPATLARDCDWLKEFGYKLKNVQPVDMFPHTYHIENVCLLSR